MRRVEDALFLAMLEFFIVLVLILAFPRLAFGCLAVAVTLVSVLVPLALFGTAALVLLLLTR